MNRMIDRLTRLFTSKGRFRLPRSSMTLPSCSVRQVEARDFDSCEEIYHLNEKEHFPLGYFPRFSESLRNQLGLSIVVEANGEVIGHGGIMADQLHGQDCAALSFGMIHPSYHGRGFGTTLLLSRLTLLRLRTGMCKVAMSTSARAEPFYRRFGFAFVQSIDTENGQTEDHYYVEINDRDQKRCLVALRHACIAPALFHSPMPGIPGLHPSPTATPENS